MEIPVINKTNETLAAIVGIATSLFAIWKFIIKPSYILYKKRMKMYSDVEKIVSEITPNGGGSMRDAITRIEKNLTFRIEAGRHQSTALGLAYWESEADGTFKYVSPRLSELIGLDRDEILGNGWITNLSEEDKLRAFNSWSDAVKQKRKFTDYYTFIHGDKSTIRVFVEAYPVMLNNQIIGWSGTFKPILTKNE